MSDTRTLALVVMLAVLVVVVVRLFRAATRPTSATPPRLTAAIGLAAIGIVWMLGNSEVEGPILFTVSSSHGVTVADLPSFALFVAAVVIAWPRSP